jgi:hypothetical protein
MSVAEIERAIRELPSDEARALLARLEAILSVPKQSAGLTDEVIAKWRGRFKLPFGKNVDDYLRIIRDGDSA